MENSTNRMAYVIYIGAKVNLQRLEIHISFINLCLSVFDKALVENYYNIH